MILSREQKESKEDGSSDMASKRQKCNHESRGILRTSSEELFDQTQSLVSEINAKRKNDSVLLAGKRNTKTPLHD